MIDQAIKLILICLLIFTPLAFGAMELWAFSLMEIGILLILCLWAIQSAIPVNLDSYPDPKSRASDRFFNPRWILLLLFLGLVFLQIIPLPSNLVRDLSPRTHEIRQALLTGAPLGPSGLSPSSSLTLSFVPFATRVELLKWLTLIALFAFLLRWRPDSRGHRVTTPLILTVFAMGLVESLYGMFEFFSGHRQVLHLKDLGDSVMGTFINRNYLAGYLLMVIPLSLGFILSAGSGQEINVRNWRHRLAILDGKTLLQGFGVVIMILGLLFSGSKMGISSLLLSFTLISLLFRSLNHEKRMSRIPLVIFALALLWAVSIGLDAVISRFLSTPESFRERWIFWTDTFRILKDFPLFGSGLGTFSQVFPMYRSIHSTGMVSHAENDFLQLASETGLVGFGLLLLAFFSFFLRAVSGIRSLPDWDPRRTIGAGGLVGILALMFHSLVERNIQVPANAFLYMVIWAMVLRLRPSHREDPKDGFREGIKRPG